MQSKERTRARFASYGLRFTTFFERNGRRSVGFLNLSLARSAQGSVRIYDGGQILGLLRCTRELERQKDIPCDFALVVSDIVWGAMSRVAGGMDVQDFVSDILMPPLVRGVYGPHRSRAPFPPEI